MELKEQSAAPSLARKLGEVPHVSGLLRRIAQTSSAGERVTDWLPKVAVQRGADHYRSEFDPSLPPDSPAFSDEQIGVALCLGEHPCSLDHLRVAAQLLSSPRVDATRLCRLAAEEPRLRLRRHVRAVGKIRGRTWRARRRHRGLWAGIQLHHQETGTDESRLSPH